MHSQALQSKVQGTGPVQQHHSLGRRDPCLDSGCLYTAVRMTELQPLSLNLMDQHVQFNYDVPHAVSSIIIGLI